MKLKPMNNFCAQALHYIPRTWFTGPGWMVKKLTKKDELKQYLYTLNIDFTVEEIMRLKQFFCNIIFITFFIYILISGNFLKGLFWDFTLSATLCYIPEIYFQKSIRHRKKILERQLPDFIDALTMAIESGLNFSNAFEYISSKSKGILGQEARFTQKEIRFGIPLTEAMINMSERINIEEFTKFTSAIQQAKKLGVSIAQTLKIQSNLIRTRRKQKAEELSRTASVKISLPLVFCIFPALLIVYLGPGLLRLLN